MTEGVDKGDQLAEISRFGPKKPPERQKALTPSEAFSEIKKAFKKEEFGFTFGGVEGEDDSWIGFSRGETSFTHEAWDGLASIELAAVEADVPIPEEHMDEMIQCYKINVAVPGERIPEFVRLIATQFDGVSFVGKVGKGRILADDRIPNVVFYVRGAHINEVLDFAIVLAKATKYQVGETPTKLISAKEIEEGSGIFLTQGEFFIKQRAKELGRFDEYYGEDGALYRGREQRYSTHLQRRRNQLKIEESLYDFVGHEKTSERLVALQEAAFEGVETDIKKGIRWPGDDVSFGEGYYPPRGADLAELVQASDAKTQELLGVKAPKTAKTRFQTDYDYAVRSASATYVLHLLMHPLLDGNSQSCANLVSSMLYEGGHSKIYFNAFLDGAGLRITALEGIQREEYPTRPAGKLADTHINDPEARDSTQKQKYYDWGRDFIKRIVSDRFWDYVKQYVDDGQLPDFEAVRRRDRKKYPEVGSLDTFLERVDGVNRYLQRALSEEPTGSRKHVSFSELQRAEVIGKRIFKRAIT